jgi:hypothetical protein
VTGAKVAFAPTTATVVGVFRDGAAAAVAHAYGKGRTLYVGACPGVTYVKDANFVPLELKEKWPATGRRFINDHAQAAGAPRLVDLSHPVVEAGVFDAERGTTLVLANFTYEPIRQLHISLPVPRPVASVRSLAQGPVRFSQEKVGAAAAPSYPWRVTCAIGLELNDMLLFE